MPGLTDQHDDAIDSNQSYFYGEPNRVAVRVKGEGEEDEEADEAAAVEEDEEDEGKTKEKDSDESSEEEIVIPKRDLTELDRLTTVVYAIENDTATIPVGSFKMTPEHQVRRNEAFAGMDASGDNALFLKNYLHFRNVQAPERKDVLDRPDVPFNKHFLEPLSADFPKGCWSVQRDDRSENVLVRSL